MLLWYRSAQFFKKNSCHCPRSWLSCHRVQIAGHVQGLLCSKLLMEHCPDLRVHVRGHGWKPIRRQRSRLQTYYWFWFSSVQSLSCVPLFAIPRTAARQASLSITNSQSLFKLVSIKLLIPSNHLILCCPLLHPSSVFPRIRVFSNDSVLCIRWPEYCSFSFSISASNDYSGLISFRMDWLDLLAVQRTLKGLLQHHSSKASILQCSAFFIVQLSHPYMTTGKTIALTRWTFVDKLMSLVFNMLSKLVITFLSSSLLISWLQSPSAVIWGPKKKKKNKVCHCFHCFPIYLPWSDGTRCHD